MIDWEHVLDIAENYKTHRIENTERFLSELRSILDFPVQIWTSPYGRGWQYEFELSSGGTSDSLLVEISNVCKVAFVYYARRCVNDVDHVHDQCSDNAFSEEYARYRKQVVSLFENLGYAIIPHSEIDVVRRGKPIYRWLISDPEE